MSALDNAASLHEPKHTRCVFCGVEREIHDDDHAWSDDGAPTGYEDFDPYVAGGGR